MDRKCQGRKLIVISAFVTVLSIISLLSIDKISSLLLAPETEQVGLCHTLSETLTGCFAMRLICQVTVFASFVLPKLS